MRKKKKLISVSGQGFGYSSEIGKFEVKYSENDKKKFNSLKKAREFYDSLEEEAAIWDISSFAELLDCKSWK